MHTRSDTHITTFTFVIKLDRSRQSHRYGQAAVTPTERRIFLNVFYDTKKNV